MRRRLPPILAAITAAVAGCSAGSVAGSGHAAREQRPIAGVSRVRFDSAGSLVIRQGSTEDLAIEADDNLLPLIESSVRDGTLVLAARPGVSIQPRTPIAVHLTVRRLDGLALAGSGTCSAPALDAGRLVVALDGSGSITLAGTASSADFSVRGSGAIDAGRLAAGQIRADLPGSGSLVLDAHGDSDLSLAGSGTVRGTIDCQRLGVRLGGVGSVELRGRVRSQEVAISGSGNYLCQDLSSTDASVSIAGVGNASVRAERTLRASISGTGSVRYVGDPIVSSQISGVGSVARF